MQKYINSKLVYPIAHLTSLCGWMSNMHVRLNMFPPRFFPQSSYHVLPVPWALNLADASLSVTSHIYSSFTFRICTESDHSAATTKIQTAILSSLDYCVNHPTHFSASALVSVLSVLNRHPEWSSKKSNQVVTPLLKTLSGLSISCKRQSSESGLKRFYRAWPQFASLA